MPAATHIDHREYPKQLRSKTMPQLLFIIKDAREAIEAMPDGHKAGFYADEIHYAAAEIKRRREQP